MRKTKSQKAAEKAADERMKQLCEENKRLVEKHKDLLDALNEAGKKTWHGNHCGMRMAGH